MPRALVIGYGSIGIRHAQTLASLGYSVTVVSRRGNVPEKYDGRRTIADAIGVGWPDYAVVATETAAHAEHLDALVRAGYGGPILVEKPLFDRPREGAAPVETEVDLSNVYVGYQLRFHPAVLRLREMIGTAPCIAAEFHVGQHIDTWRPGRGGRDSYSGHANMGGGALRDLSHELDLAQFLFGGCLRVAALGGRLADVTADSDDAWGILARFERCQIVTFQLNYLDRTPRRRIVVVAQERSICADLITGAVTCDGTSVSLANDRDTPFEAMHRSALESHGRGVCDFASGLRVVKMIDAVERAARTGTWIEP